MRLVKCGVMAVIGAFVGYWFFKVIQLDAPVWFAALVFAGFPSGWAAVSKFTNTIPILVHPMFFLVMLMIKFIGGLFIGWIVFPIEIIKGIREVVAGKRVAIE